jgi:hypothetical protein
MSIIIPPATTLPPFSRRGLGRRRPSSGAEEPATSHIPALVMEPAIDNEAEPVPLETVGNDDTPREPKQFSGPSIPQAAMMRLFYGGAAWPRRARKHPRRPRHRVSPIRTRQGLPSKSPKNSPALDRCQCFARRRRAALGNDDGVNLGVSTRTDQSRPCAGPKHDLQL